MSITLFGEPELLPIQPRFASQFSPFTKSTITQLYELIDPSPIYSLTWNNDGTELFVPTSTNGLHHIPFHLHTVSSFEQASSQDVCPTLTPSIIRLTDTSIIKLIPAPENTKKFLTLTLTAIKIFEILTSAKRGVEYKLLTTIEHPLTYQTKSQSLSSYPHQQYLPLIPPSNTTKPCFLDVSWKTNHFITVLDSSNNLFTYNLLAQSPCLPIKSNPIAAGLSIPDPTLTKTSAHLIYPNSTLNNGTNAFQLMRSFGLYQPSAYPDLITQLFPKAAAAFMASNGAVAALLGHTNQPPTEGAVVEQSNDNNATIYQSSKLSPITTFLPNNTTDEHTLVATGHGEIMFCDGKSSIPFNTKKITSSPIHVLATSTMTSPSSPHSNKFIREFQHEYQSVWGQLMTHTRLQPPKVPNVAINEANAKRMDDKFNQLSDLRTGLARLGSQIQNQQFIAVGSDDGLVTVLSAIDLALQYTIQAHDHPIISLSFSPCGTFLASLSFNPRSLVDLEDGNINMVKGLFCITHLPTGNPVYQRQNHGITAFAWNPMFPTGVFVSVLCVSAGGTSNNYSERGRRFGGSDSTVKSNPNFISQLTILNYADSLIPPVNTLLSTTVTEKILHMAAIDAQLNDNFQSQPQSPQTLRIDDLIDPQEVMVELDGPAPVAIKPGWETESTSLHHSFPPDPYWASSLISQTGCATPLPTDSNPILTAFHQVETLHYPQSATLMESMNKTMAFNIIDNITPHSNNPPSNHSRGHSQQPWSQQVQYKLNELQQRFSAWKSLGEQHRVNVQRIILNQPDPTSISSTGMMVKVDRFAHIKDNLADFVAGADEVETVATHTTASHFDSSHTHSSDDHNKEHERGGRASREQESVTTTSTTSTITSSNSSAPTITTPSSATTACSKRSQHRDIPTGGDEASDAEGIAAPSKKKGANRRGNNNHGDVGPTRDRDRGY